MGEMHERDDGMAPLRDRMSNLPSLLLPLVGRQAALDEVKSLLARTRLLTLTGPGGCGKTRLALQVARDIHSMYVDGAWLVELAPLLDASLLPQTIAAALHARESPSRSPTDALLDCLRQRDMLLVLDNCEHLLPACVRLVETLLEAAPQLHILATSREALNSSHEAVWLVPPLALPDQDASLTPERAGAVQLFLQRAAAVVPAFALTAQNAPAVARICRRVDGIPLAIELAAGCLRMLAPEQIAAQLESGFHLLAHGPRTAPPRQRTVEATMEWSYHLMTAEEQALFRRLSVLAGDFTLDAMEAVGGEARDASLLRLMRLIDQSLVVVVRHVGATRYRLLEILRQYGHQQLEAAGEACATYERYGAWAARLAGVAVARAGASDRAAWMDRLELEIEHLRAALRWLLERGRAEDALSLAAALADFWRQRGHIGEGRRWLQAALAAPPATVPAAVRARALNALGVLLMWQCAYAEAETAHTEALALYDQAGDQPGSALSWFRLGFLADKRADYAAAVEHLERSLHLYAQLEDEQGVEMARNRLGITAWNRGDYATATTALERGLRFQRAHGQVGAAAASLLNLGMLALEQGDTARAAPLLGESLALNRTIKDDFAAAHALTTLGYAALAERDLARADRRLREALALLAVESASEVLFRLLDGMAMVAAGQGEALRAARVWGAVETQRATYGVQYRPVERSDYDRAVAAACLDADAVAFDAAWDAGRALSLDAAIAAVRESSPPPLSIHISHADERRPALRIYGLGTVEVFRGARPLSTTDLTYAKAKELLYYLLRHPPRTKEHIGLALWPDATPDYLRTTFRVIIYHLRRALGGADWIVREREYYTFNRSLPYWHDVEAFETALLEAERQRLSAPGKALALLETADVLYRGDYWEGATTSEWIAQQQETLRRCHHGVLLTLGELYSRRGDPRRALETFLRAVERDAYCEEAHRGAMRCYLLLHEPSQAMRQYERLRRELERDLGTRPDPETLALLRSHQA